MNNVYYQHFKNILRTSSHDIDSIVCELKTPYCNPYVYEIIYAMIKCDIHEDIVNDVFEYHLNTNQNYKHLDFLNHKSKIAMENVLRISSAISCSQYAHECLANWLFIQSSYGFPMEFCDSFPLIVTKKLSLNNPPNRRDFNFMIQCIVNDLIEDDLFDDYLKTEKRFREKDTILRTIEYISASDNLSRTEKEILIEKFNRQYARTVLLSSKYDD